MPVIKASTYRPPVLFQNTYLQTIYASKFRKLTAVAFERERVTMPDDDFVDLDWSKTGNNKLIIALHGLEGSTNSNYIQAVIKQANDAGWDGVGMNFRSCSGESNKALRTYHCGETTDLDFIIQHIDNNHSYDKIAIIGFSLGGNVTLKYAGEQSTEIHDKIIGVAAASAPIDLVKSSKNLEAANNILYRQNFLKCLREKIVAKKKQYPHQIDIEGIEKIKTFAEFDTKYTAPMNGFIDAWDYYEQSSSLQYIPQIVIPTLLINAEDDTLLADSCYPIELAKQLEYFHLEVSKKGGHIGFVEFNKDQTFWIEKRLCSFISNLL